MMLACCSGKAPARPHLTLCICGLTRDHEGSEVLEVLSGKTVCAHAPSRNQSLLVA